MTELKNKRCDRCLSNSLPHRYYEKCGCSCHQEKKVDFRWTKSSIISELVKNKVRDDKESI